MNNVNCRQVYFNVCSQSQTDNNLQQLRFVCYDILLTSYFCDRQPAGVADKQFDIMRLQTLCALTALHCSIVHANSLISRNRQTLCALTALHCSIVHANSLISRDCRHYVHATALQHCSYRKTSHHLTLDNTL